MQTAIALYEFTDDQQEMLQAQVQRVTGLQVSHHFIWQSNCLQFSSTFHFICLQVMETVSVCLLAVGSVCQLQFYNLSKIILYTIHVRSVPFKRL